jgi:hypothetical protein
MGLPAPCATDASESAAILGKLFQWMPRLASFVVSMQLQAKSRPNSFAQAICRKWLKQERGATKIHGPLPVLFILGLGYDYDRQFEAHRSKADSQIHA